MEFNSEMILSMIESDNTKEFFAVEPLGADIILVNEHNFKYGGEVIECSDELLNCRTIIDGLLEKQLISTTSLPPNATFRTILPLTYFEIWRENIDSEYS